MLCGGITHAIYQQRYKSPSTEKGEVGNIQIAIHKKSDVGRSEKPLLYYYSLSIKSGVCDYICTANYWSFPQTVVTIVLSVIILHSCI